MSDDVPGENSEYGNIKQIKADLFELKQAVADLEAKTEPLQDFTNRVNQILQRLSAIERKVGIDES